MKNFILIAISAVFLTACGGRNDNGTTKIKEGDKVNTTQVKQLNISILLDLSDRINPQINSCAQGNDIEIIRTITEYFKSNMANLGAYKAKGKIRVFFSPAPSNSNINTIVSKLNIDCSKLDNKGRKGIYDSITNIYVNNLREIYNETIATSVWNGSDIWRFFKDDVKDFCIQKDTVYRNILIILTDGYLYHNQSVYSNTNRYSYLLGNTNLKPYRKQNWEQLIEQNDFGIMVEQEDLSNLEVLVLEIKAENPNNKIDEDILRFLWKKWFKDMNINHYEAYSSDLPANTKTRIEGFLNIN